MAAESPMTRVVPRGTVAKPGQALRRARYSAADLAIIAKVQNLRAQGMPVTNRDLAIALGRSESALKSKLSRLKTVKPYRRVGPGLPGRRRREDREVHAGPDAAINGGHGNEKARAA